MAAEPGPRQVPLLVGRGDEQRLLNELINGLATGGGGGLVVRGDPGVGKSALLAEAAGLAAAWGFRVLRATGVQAAA